MKLAATSLIAALALLLGGCAAGNRIDYRQSVPAIALHSAAEKKTIEVAVRDQRPYVTSGRKRGAFLGVMRALSYIPYSITTVSGMSLSNDLQQATLTTLNRQSINTEPLSASYERARSSDHLLLRMTLREWKNDVYMRARFDYDVTVEVIDHEGAVLASKTARHSGAINHFIEGGAAVLREVIGDGQVVEALTGKLETDAHLNASSTAAPPVAKPANRLDYDDCMRRILKITDKQLRLHSMSACDAAI